MTKKTIVIIFLCLVLILVLGFLGKIFILDRRVNAFSGLKINSIPRADISLNTKSVGKSPYENTKLTPGEYTLKLSVTGTFGNYYPWSTKIKLVPESLTYVNRILGPNDQQSSHQIVWLEKLANQNSKELAVVTSPDGATIEVDGLDEGSAPKIISNLGAGDHTIVISKNGYSDQVVEGIIVAGKRLNISAKLAKSVNLPELSEKPATESAKPATSSAKPNPALPYILIKETGLGFLRVRFGPTTSASETGKVNVGEKFPLLKEESGWTQIKIGTSSGWVSDQYIEKFK